MEHLTQQEETAMRRLWALGDGTVKDLLEQYDEPVPPYTTLASVVKNLERKGYVRARRVGNTYLYAPAVSEADYKRHGLRRMVSNYFGNSYKEMVSFFVREEHLSASELEELVQLIKQQENDAL
ncbi:MAG: BlaI/MecI/CopY family transcriptional regulator [Bacteroidaceae bacterium]|nr:BlaI/MecI/CopY family transcriptional regulator [Bacteroidaceae bacterium]